MHQIQFRLGLRYRPRYRRGLNSATQTTYLELRRPTPKEREREE